MTTVPCECSFDAVFGSNGALHVRPDKVEGRGDEKALHFGDNAANSRDWVCEVQEELVQEVRVDADTPLGNVAVSVLLGYDSERRVPGTVRWGEHDDAGMQPFRHLQIDYEH
ncbi:hypothetical protein QOT17_25652 [Balamuthia mandrillaris]